MVITKKGIASNQKTFKVNDEPVGPGLCALKNPDDTPKVNGRMGDSIRAVGARFDETQGLNNLVFSNKQNAIILSPDKWKDSEIITTVPVNTVSGPVAVYKKVEAGRKCVGFSIASWCPSNKYDVIYKDVFSNSLPLQIFDTCDSGYLTTLGGREPGFPIVTFSRTASGSKEDYDKINLGNLASDGTYLYSMHEPSGKEGNTIWGQVDGDNISTIYKIGTGYNGTELGRVYKKYQFTKNVFLPGSTESIPDANPPVNITATSLISTDSGIYLGAENHIRQRFWLPTNHLKYNVPMWLVWKVKFDEVNNTYDYEGVEIPQGLIVAQDPNWPITYKDADRFTNGVMLKNTRNNIVAIAADENGFTFQVLNNDWLQVNKFTVKNAYMVSTVGNGTYTATYPVGVLDDKYFYNVYNGNVYVVDWQKGEWKGAYTGHGWYTKEMNGTFDWKNGKYWFGINMNDIPITWLGDFYSSIVPFSIFNHNRIYRYSECAVPTVGFCRSDVDCKQGAMCSRSKCENGLCTPEIKSFSPLSGAVGTWLTITGCHFGCQPGQIYFGGSIANDQIPTDGLVAGYTFNSADNNGLFRSSLSSPDISSQLNGATISDGVLNATTGYFDLDDRLGKNQNFGGPDKGKLTLLMKIKPTSFVKEGPSGQNVIGLTYGIVGTYYLAIGTGDTNTAVLITYVKTANGSDVNLYSSGSIIKNQWNYIALVLEAGVGYKYYINGKMTDDVPLPNLKLYSWNQNTSLAQIYQKFAGQIDEFFMYNRALTSQEIQKFTFGAKGLELADPACWPNWRCSISGGYDEVTVEVPNRNTPTNPADDALTGAIKLITYKGLLDTSDDLPGTPIFTVNTDPLGPQICKLIPNYGNRKINVRIYGENFGSTPASGDHVNFDPQEKELFNDLNNNGVRDADEPYNDYNGNGQYDAGNLPMREPFLDYGSDKLPDQEEPGYDPQNNPDPNKDNLDGISSGTQGNHSYDEGEPFIDYHRTCVAGANAAKPCQKDSDCPQSTCPQTNNAYDPDVASVDYISQITNFITKAIWPGCPETGWDDKNICFAVPNNAAGFGTETETALNKVSVNKGVQESGSKQFEVTFGSCGNQKIEHDKGETCDGSLMPDISSTEKNKICTQLFSPLYPDEEISKCYVQCDTSCSLLFCVGSDCKSDKDLCGNNIIDEFFDVDKESIYHEQCDTNTYPTGLTCTEAGYPYDKVCESGDKANEACSSDDDCSSNKKCVGGDTSGDPCTTNADCVVGGSCKSDIACIQSCKFQCGECVLLICSKGKVCASGDKVNESCSTDADCSSNKKCVGGDTPGDPCTTNADCGDGGSCNSAIACQSGCRPIKKITCGNGKINIPADEQCDCGSDNTCTAAELNNRSCDYYNGKVGDLACYPPQDPSGWNDCRFNTDDCEKTRIDPVCTADSDCLACGSGNSHCINVYCSPYITDLTPVEGKIGTWVTLTGCYFGCSSGSVYFQGDQMVTLPDTNKNGLVAGYLFNELVGGKVKDISGNNYNGILYKGAKIENGNLVLSGGDSGSGDYMNIDMT
ncbi:MAG: LamG domain-containing protein, partial [Candidatus Parcubacteria bacterium]|nr:LamG domain-containing protein [Candidatus Parcubacteria bacterium]